MADRISNRQSIQITGSSGVSIGPVTQNNAAPGREPEEPREKVRILFVAANPDGTSRLRLDREAKAIEQALRSSKARDRFDLQQVPAATAMDLQDRLLQVSPHIVHFSGHGEDDGGLVLEKLFGEQGGHFSASPEGLASLFSRLRPKLRCLVLNACHSATLARLAAESIDCAIGMTDALDDILAVLFSSSLYGALGNGESVQSAFDWACAQIRTCGGEASLIPKLFARADSGQRVLFDQAGLVEEQ